MVKLPLPAEQPHPLSQPSPERHNKHRHIASVFLFCAETELHPQEEQDEHEFPLLLFKIISKSMGRESNIIYLRIIL